MINIDTPFFVELLKGILAIYPLYLASYFTSSYILFNSPHGNIAEWKQKSVDLSLIVKSSKIVPNQNGERSKVDKVIGEATRPQIIDLSSCIELMNRAEKRLSLYKSKERFVIFGFLVSFSISLINSIPIIITGSPIVTNLIGYAGVITTLFGLVFVACFNWSQSTEWNQFKDSIEENREFVDKHGF